MKRYLPWSLLFAALLAALVTMPAHAEPSPDGEPLTTLPRHLVGFELKSILPKAYLPNPKHQYQGLNNCGPTTTAIAISNWGVMRSQTDVVNAVKPNAKDVNVNPYEIAQYIRDQGLGAQVRVNGSRETLHLLVSNDIPVMVEQWLLDDGGMGHYRLVTGYNAERDTFTFDDSLLGPDQRWSWDEFNARWGEFNANRIFIPVYRPEQEPLIRAILGPDASDSQMWQRVEANARAAVDAEPGSGLQWFALGDALLNQGRNDEAVQAYDKAYGLGLPFRYYWYQFGHFEALAKAGRWQRLLQLTQPVLARAPVHEEMLYYKGLALENMGDKAGAREAYAASIAANRFYARAQEALARLGG